ncbi:MAG: hypothetical protein KYX69_13500 [Sphingomonas sp.]|uniref:hypothetical protein n=1 Tax=Sphingomonas sp. TaxID=28214 RepID=UPI0026077E56|nr:hypothetical protein [Sphingomonas sp.]MDK2768721.1 hypothetical protein [Sphingomonas sp.]
MTPDAPVPTAPARGNSMTMILVAGLIAFIAGLAVMAVVYRAGDWWGQPAVAPATVVQPPISAAPVTAPGMDVATLAAREQALAARLESLDARLKATDADARVAASYAGRAEAMMLVFGARRALERGQELGIVAGELRRRLGAAEPNAVATVVSASGEPITLEDLRVAFDQIAPRLSTSQPDDGWLSAIQRELSTLVIIRKQDAPSPHPRERLARARRLLGQGHVEAALAEVSRLPGAQGAESWMAAAGRYIATRRALDTLEDAAIEGKAQPAAGATAPAAPAQKTVQGE